MADPGLTAAETRQLVRAVTALASPLEYATLDGWRAAVTQEAGRLVGADSTGFILPAPDSLLLYSAEHDPAELARYPDLPLPRLPDGGDVFAGLVRRGAATLAETWDGEPERYLNSEHYTELAARNRAFDTLSGFVPVSVDANPGAAGLHFWHEKPGGRKFGVRERRVVSLLLPALKAGAATALRLGNRQPHVLGAVEDLRAPALVYDSRGVVLNRSERLENEFQEDPESGRLLDAMLAVARSTVAFGQPRSATVPGGLAFSDEVTTRRARYSIHGSLVDSEGPLGERLAIVVLERLTPVVLVPAELQARYGLSAAEVRVATALAAGASNAAVARDLHISPHTARRHTEAILAKVGVKTRSELVPRLLR